MIILLTVLFPPLTLSHTSFSVMRIHSSYLSVFSQIPIEVVDEIAKYIAVRELKMFCLVSRWTGVAATKIGDFVSWGMVNTFHEYAIEVEELCCRGNREAHDRLYNPISDILTACWCLKNRVHSCSNDVKQLDRKAGHRPVKQRD